MDPDPKIEQQRPGLQIAHPRQAKPLAKLLMRRLHPQRPVKRKKEQNWKNPQPYY
jgi:hypothetical protein